ncbi:MAG: hypothetical protein QM779_15250 [Propionicimonas sp.]|uniref:P-loop NTPase n=1 Tax=Propionicimonas sp. TaxID=1955623 RepID=UPI003D0DEF23
MLLLGQASVGEAAADLSEGLPSRGAKSSGSLDSAQFASLDELLAGYAWNAIATSRTDARLAADLARSWRTVGPVGADSVLTRNAAALQIQYLFGGSALPPDDQPPADLIDESDRFVRVRSAVARLVTETVTPRGLIAIEGWRPDDWLSAQELMPLIRRLPPGQAHLFSVEPDLGENPYVAAAVASGGLTLHSESLAMVLADLAEEGALPRSSVDRQSSRTRVIALGSGFVQVDVHTWNEVRRSARPIDIALLEPPVLGSKAAKYQIFREFTGASEGATPWEAIAAGIPYRREFEQQLATRVADSLAGPDLPRPIILAGQTATGKSVALARLAASLALTGDAAVLHQARRGERPSLEDIDAYADWVESHGGHAVVLVWDGMVPASEYDALSRQLRARGRRVLVVGSTYPAQDAPRDWVQAPAQLTRGELHGLVPWFASFDIRIAEPAKLDASFLALLYRVLPETEHQLKRGLALEIRAAEKSMEESAKAVKAAALRPEQRLTAMAEALQAAGVSLADLRPASDPDQPVAELSFGARSAMQQLSGLVLTAGRHGIPVPVDLALRVVGGNGSLVVRDAVRHFDILRWLEDDSGEYFLTARTSLEAELAAREDLTPQVEVEVICSAIRELRASQGWCAGQDEVQFMVSLLERVGPQSPRGGTYQAHYLEIADALRDLRMRSGVVNPRLVLQESNFARAHVHWQQNTHAGSLDERMGILEDNRELVQEALNDPSVRGPMRLSLAVELGSTLGAMTHELVAAGHADAEGQISSRLSDILDVVNEARAIDPENMYPVDVLAWSTRDAVESGSLSRDEQIDRLANAVASIDSIDRSVLTSRQSAQLDRRSVELNQLLGNQEEVYRHLQSLSRSDDPAATYFLCRFDLQAGPSGEAAALKRLLESPATVKSDWRCAQLLTGLFWRSLTGSKFLAGERELLRLSLADWERVLAMAAELAETPMPDQYRPRFMQGLALFHLGRFVEAKHVFQDVEQATRQIQRRIFTAYLVAQATGEPRVFTGRVRWSRGNVASAWVNELATEVSFVPATFSPNQEFTRDQPLAPFHIGFKLRGGAVAEPRHFASRAAQ